MQPPYPSANTNGAPQAILQPPAPIVGRGWRRLTRGLSDQLDGAQGVVYVCNMQQLERACQWVEFGDVVRRLREARAETDAGFSLRQVAMRCGVTPAYLSRIERGEVAPPGEETLIKLARELGEHHRTDRFDPCDSMGAVVETHLAVALGRHLI